MPVIYISSTMRYDDFAELFKDASLLPGQQVQKFHRLLIDGFAQNEEKVKVISAVPVTRQTYKKKFFPGARMQDGNISYQYLALPNFPGIKNVFQFFGAFFGVLFSAKNDFVVCDVLNASVSYGACLAAKLRRKICVGIITDLPQLLSGSSDNSFFNSLVYRVIALCTHYVLLTEQMNDVVNPLGKPHIVVEGFSDKSLSETPKSCTSGNINCIYAGQLCEKYGIKTMVEGFILANVPNSELHLYGSGTFVDELLEICKAYKNIIYHGVVLNDEVVRAELEADLLINPRPTHEEFTKYSFPSKNMEYMASGTAVLTTHLPGMPDDHLPYVYLIEEETVNGVADALTRVMNLSREERDAKGAAAKRFVMEKKSNVYQAKRILDFIAETSSTK